jgi:vitamin B12 transporter
MRSKIILAFIVCIQTNLVTHAQEMRVPRDMPSHLMTTPNLKTVTVTASRIPTRTDAVISDVEVFTRTEIAASTAQDLAAFLQNDAQLQTANNGGPGQVSSVFTRGTNSNHTLLLIDGLRYGSLSTGTVIWENIPMSSIERIEVLRGPASALYGSDAVGGVVQVFTRGTSGLGEKGFKPNFSLTLGTNHEYEVVSGFSAVGKKLSLNLQLSQKLLGNFSAVTPKLASTYQPDKDPFRQRVAHLQLQWKLNKDWSIGLGSLRSRGLNHYDDGKTTEGNYLDTYNSLQTDTTQIHLQGKPTKRWKTNLRFGRTIDGYETKVGVYLIYGPQRYRTIQDQWTWQNDIILPIVGVLTLGTEHLTQRLATSGTYSQKTRRINAFFTGIHGQQGRHTWQFNVRRDRNSQFGTVDTGLVGYSFALKPSLKLRTSYGTSFVAPSFNNLYSGYYNQSNGIFIPTSNPELRPESGRNTEVGLQWQYKQHQLDTSVYQNKIKDLIVYDTNIQKPVNVESSRIRGMNIRYSLRLNQWGIRASYDYLDPRNLNTQKILPRRARQHWGLSLDYRLNRWLAGLDWQHTGKRSDSWSYFNADTSKIVTSSVTLPAYDIFNLSIQYHLNKDWYAQLKIRNITNKQYETVYGYRQPGRGVYITLGYQTQ